MSLLARNAVLVRKKRDRRSRYLTGAGNERHNGEDEDERRPEHAGVLRFA